MTPDKTVREVMRAYRRVAERAKAADERFERARHAAVARLCGPVATACGTDFARIEARLLANPAAHVFVAATLDEAMRWVPPEGPSVLDELLADRTLRKRPVTRRYLERLRDAEPRLLTVVEACDGSRASVRRHGGDGPPLRVELLDDTARIEPGDCVVARRVRLGPTRVFAEGWLAFPGGVAPALREPEGAALVERAFCLQALLALDERTALERWLIALGGAPDPGAGRGARGASGRAGARGSGRAPPPRRPRTATDDPERERLLERIRKLFAMARETESSPHEAEIALRRCQSLMSRFGITEADLETSEFAVASVATGRTVATHVKLLGGAVALLHDVLFVIGRGGLAEFRGYEVDVQVATMTFEYLSEAVERALSARKRRGELPPGRSAAFDYRVAFADEVYRRVRVLAAEREAAERALGSTGTALVVRKRERVDREFGEGLVSRPLRLRGPVDDGAAEAGREDGQGVSLDPQIG